MEQSVEAMRAIPARLVAAWNDGDATAFFADFADDADFVEFEGTVLKGRTTLIETQQPIFDTVMKGSRLERSEVPFARIVASGWGVVHHRVGIQMPGEETPPPHRYVMQLLALVWQNDRWEVAALQNCRVISFETAMALESLPAAG
ncbi:SgcJ/EcaC family oxidoreductase [Catenuloplanes japonicus]|uniref:SgcJ/EcaC family oxidoreductase n=1 Tax=Catenuloplanes japonicus TaxID=33876 RepID=UPI0005278001|nr:SgcJ/EcaC family oxidoreductase [Catenuloplanes japonicus]